MTLTTYDEALCRKLEPGVCTTQARFAALQQLREAGIPTVVWLSPILPFLNDTEENINGLLDLCQAAGVKGVLCFGMGPAPGEPGIFLPAVGPALPWALRGLPPLLWPAVLSQEPQTSGAHAAVPPTL